MQVQTPLGKRDLESSVSQANALTTQLLGLKTKSTFFQCPAPTSHGFYSDKIMCFAWFAMCTWETLFPCTAFWLEHRPIEHNQHRQC